MSRIGKVPVKFDANVQVSLHNKNVVINGPKGSLSFTYSDEVQVKIEDGALVVVPKDNSAKARSMWGLTRSMIANMVRGVSVGFEKRLEMTGVGYRASYANRLLTLALGYSTDIIYEIPQAVEVVMEKPTVILLTSYDKQMLGQTAAAIRALRPPEPYKGKGIKYENEYIVRKVGKKK